jgi:ribose transport system ATP-binding protein
MRRDAGAALERLGVAIGLDRPVGELSIAEQQLVEIARATLNREISLLILDEPTAALGSDEINRLHQVVRRFAQQSAVLYVSHRLEETLAIADVVTVLRDGRVVGESAAAATSVQEVAQTMIGTELEEYFARDEAGVGEQLLEARGVRSAAMRAGVTFSVRRGEVLGLGGLTGSGRTRIARAICGVDPLVSGELLLEGRRVRLRSPSDAIAAGIAFAPENRKADALFFNLSVPQNITIAGLGGISRGPLISLGAEDRRARGIGRLLKLAPGAERRQVGFLSGGTQQKVVLGRWLFAGVKLLVLDEPTQGIDVGAKREIYRLIDDLTNNGAGIIVISSDYQELLSISDRVAVLCNGEIVHGADRGDLSQAELLELASSGGRRAIA